MDLDEKIKLFNKIIEFDYSDEEIKLYYNDVKNCEYCKWWSYNYEEYMSHTIIECKETSEIFKKLCIILKSIWTVMNNANKSQNYELEEWAFYWLRELKYGLSADRNPFWEEIHKMFIDKIKIYLNSIQNETIELLNFG